MNPQRTYRDLSPRDYAALQDAAKRRAVALRRAAMNDVRIGVSKRASAAAHALLRAIAARRVSVRVEA